MRLISQIVYALVSMTLTGTLALGVWWTVVRICEGRYPELVYLMLRIVCLLYLVPVVYFLMRLTVHDGYIHREGILGWEFMLAGIEWQVGTVIGVAWMLFMLFNFVSILVKSRDEKRKLRSAGTPEDDPAVLAEFERVAARMRIRRKIRVYRNSCLGSPAIGGICFVKIYLPYGNFTREELSVVFHHELVHFRQHDRFFHLISRFAGILLGAGSIPGRLPEFLTEWSEICCDRRTVEALDGEVDERRYFEIIVNIMEKISGRYCGEFVYSTLYESHLRLERRIGYMMEYRKTKPVAKGAAALAALAFITMSVSTTYAAGVQISEVHDFVYGYAEETTADPLSMDADAELTEVYLPAEEDDTYDEVVYGEVEFVYTEDGIAPLLDANEMASFNWLVLPGQRYISKNFYVKSGQKIVMSCSTIPASSVYWIGIMDKWNNVRYVEGSGALGHEFAISSSGDYCVLVQNRSDVNITAGGSYYFY